MMLLSLTACTTTGTSIKTNTYQSYLDKKGLPAPTLKSFPHCRAYGCAKTDMLSITDKDWQDIATLFTYISNPAEERAALSPAIALFEQKIGALNGTAADKKGTFAGVGKTGQHDCVDESINTTIYLSLLVQQGWLKHHIITAPISRTPATTLLSGKFWPHQTAVITAKETGARYAVDSWFHDNGTPAEIVPLKEWLRGWGPN